MFKPGDLVAKYYKGFVNPINFIVIRHLYDFYYECFGLEDEEYTNIYLKTSDTVTVIKLA